MGTRLGINPPRAARRPDLVPPARTAASANRPKTRQVTAVRTTKLTVRRSSTPVASAPMRARSNELHCGVASSPSKLTLMSRSITKMTRLAVRSKGTTNPSANPRRPWAPKRNQPSRPQVANRTLNTSPRWTHCYCGTIRLGSDAKII